jgi:hypothetical protein
MPNISKNLKVNYVAPPKKEGAGVTIKPATVIEVVHEGVARLDLSGDGKDTALAQFSTDHSQPNTFDFIPESPATPAPAPPK